MAIYKGGDLDNLIDLINENNPDLPWPLDKVNFIYGKPAPIVGATDAQPNTTVRVQAKFNSTYRGSIDVAYRRVNLATLFRGYTYHHLQMVVWLYLHARLTPFDQREIWLKFS